MTVIGEDILVEACEGHVQQMGASVENIVQVLVDLDVSPDEVAHAIVALGSARDDGSVEFDRSAYLAAALDGFVLAMRAARIAESR